MRIVFVGNQDNNAYRICKWIRRRGFDVTLYLIHEETGPRSQPEYVDVDLEGNYPPWIRWYDDAGKMWFLKSSKLARRIEGECDVVVTSGARGLLAARHFRHAPIVHITLGSEVNDFPMRLFKLSAGPAWWVVAFQMRRSLRQVRKIVTLGFWPEMRVLARLGLMDKGVVWGFPEDAEGNRARVRTEQLARLNAKYSQYDRVFTWLGRLNFLDESSVEYKAPERFLEAFEGIALGGRHNVKAVIGTHGADVEAFKQLVTDKGLDPHVDYVPHLPFWEMLTYASIDNAVVVDTPDTARGHIIGGLVREMMSVGAPVITAWDEEMVDLCYGPGCPILHAADAPTCMQAMTSVLEMTPDEYRQWKADCLEWASTHLHYEKPIARLLDVMREAVFCERFRNEKRR